MSLFRWAPPAMGSEMSTVIKHFTSRIIHRLCTWRPLYAMRNFKVLACVNKKQVFFIVCVLFFRYMQTAWDLINNILKHVLHILQRFWKSFPWNLTGNDMSLPYQLFLLATSKNTAGGRKDMVFHQLTW